MATTRLLLAVALVLGITGACARAYPPPGGERDTQPPRLLETAPAPLAVVPPFDGPVVFHFDDRISERQFSETLVVVSPLDGALRVQRSGREVRVRIDGGWRADRVYRVVLLPGVRDLFGNVRGEAAEIVFSTGPEIAETAIAGIVLDRITGGPAQNGVVTATRREDGVEYIAVADTGGFYSLRHLPLGEYGMRAFADMNRNRRRDPAEPVDSGHVAQLTSTADTVALVFNVMPIDTTPPRVVRAEAVDSLHVTIAFDDYFDVSVPLTATAEVHRLPDSVRVAGATRLVHAPVFERERAGAAAEAAAADAAAAAAAADTAAADTVQIRPAPLRRQPAAAQRPLLPARDIVAELGRPLPPGRYTITVGGAVNISGLTGGGIAPFEVRAAPPPADTTPAAPRSPPDTVPAQPPALPPSPPDTVPAPPPALPPSPPDTVPAPPPALPPSPPDTVTAPPTDTALAGAVRAAGFAAAAHRCRSAIASGERRRELT